MKAILPSRPALAAVAAVLTLASSCSPPRVVPSPAPTPTATPAPPQPPPPPQVDWREAPITPGNWEWRMSAGQSVATFGGGKLVLRCNPVSRTITMLRSGTAAGTVPMTIHTWTTSKPLSGTAEAGPPPAIAVTFQARDPLLDAMAFSRGRFAVEAAGQPTLYVPSWAEVSRVIEDCR